MTPASLASAPWSYFAPIILLVWPPQVQIRSAGDGNSGELGHRLRGILLRGARQPDRQRGLFAGRAQDHPRVITLIVFAGFTAVYFKEPLSLTQGAGFALIALGAILVFRGQA
jgi:putative drug/metabolite transporter DUF486